MPNLASFFLSLIGQDGRCRRCAARHHHGVGGCRRLRRAVHHLRRFGRRGAGQGHHAAGRGLGRGLLTPGYGHHTTARGDHAPTVAGPARSGDDIPKPELVAPLWIPPPPLAPTDELGFFVFVLFPNGTAKAVVRRCRVADAVLEEAPPSPRTATRPRLLDSASMEGRRRLFGRGITTIDRRPSRYSGLTSDLPNGVPVGIVHISSSEEEGSAAASTP
ncbi:hypothetical protein VPH35_126760 [Triticum aestivum]